MDPAEVPSVARDFLIYKVIFWWLLLTFVTDITALSIFQVLSYALHSLQSIYRLNFAFSRNGDFFGK